MVCEVFDDGVDDDESNRLLSSVCRVHVGGVGAFNSAQVMRSQPIRVERKVRANRSKRRVAKNIWQEVHNAVD